MSLIASWVDSANDPYGPFPLNNLPCGVFSQNGETPRCGMAIGSFVLDVTALEAEGTVALDCGPFLDVPFWNDLMAAGPVIWDSLRQQITDALRMVATRRSLIEDHLIPLAKLDLHLQKPVQSTKPRC